MVKAGDADGMVGGAIHSTGDLLRPALQIIKTAPGAKAVTSFNLMLCPPQGNQYCPDGLVVFADCGLNQDPTAEELAAIADSSARSFKALVGPKPCIAMLSHSTILVFVFTAIDFCVSTDNSVMQQAYTLLLQEQNYHESSAMLWFYFVIVLAVIGTVIALYNRFCIRRWE